MPTTGRVIAETLKAYDTEVFFCVTGGDQALWIGLDDVGIRVVNCRSESAATYMADGYARLTGRPGFVYGQYGPGVANVAASLADPFWAMSPVISLTSATRSTSRGRFEYQELDQLPMHGPVTIWNESVDRPDRAAAMVRTAIRVATGQVPGPVHLELPTDVLGFEVDGVEVYREPGAGVLGATRTPAPAGAMREVVERLLRAQRPLLLAGNGVMLSSAWDELTALAEALSVPVVTSAGGKGAISEDSDLAVGVVGRYSRKVANDVVRSADCVVVVGSRLGGLVTDGWQLLPAGAEIVHIDTDWKVLGHNYREAQSIVADAKAALAEAASIVEQSGYSRPRTPWARSVAEQVARWRSEAARMAEEEPSDGIHPARVVAAVRDVLGPADVVVADTGYMAAWAAVVFPVQAGRTLLRAAGSLGWGFPAALGATLAAGDRRVVALVGDGGIGYHIGELETALRCDIPTVAVVLNNRCLAFEYHDQRYLWNNRIVPQVNDFHDVDYGAVARAYGAHGSRVVDGEQLTDALKDALASGKPAIVDVVTTREVPGPVTVFEGSVPRRV
jgi:acetolactate synthase I/II/III large subunit